MARLVWVLVNTASPSPGGSVGRQVTLVRLLQLRNAAIPILVTLAGMVILVRLVCSNAENPILVTLAGMVMLARLVCWNADPPILIKVLGSVMLARLVQRKNALAPIEVSWLPASKVMPVRSAQP